MLTRICDDLSIHDKLFQQIRDTGGRIEFFIGWYSDRNTGELFSSSLLKKLGELQIDLALDIYCE